MNCAARQLLHQHQARPHARRQLRLHPPRSVQRVRGDVLRGHDVPVHDAAPASRTRRTDCSASSSATCSASRASFATIASRAAARSTGSRSRGSPRRAVAGIDQTNSFGYRQQLKGQGPQVGISWGRSPTRAARTTIARTTRDTRSTSARPRRTTSRTRSTSRTSIGAQRFFDAQYQSQGRGYGFRPVPRRPTPRGSASRGSSRPRRRPTARSSRKPSAGATGCSYGGRTHRPDERVRPQGGAHDLSARRDLVRDLRRRVVPQASGSRPAPPADRVRQGRRAAEHDRRAAVPRCRGVPDRAPRPTSRASVSRRSATRT